MDRGLEQAFQTGTLNNIWFSTKTIPREVGMQPGHKNQNKIEILTSILHLYPKLNSLYLKKFGNILAKKLFLKVSMHSNEQEMQNIMFN